MAENEFNVVPVKLKDMTIVGKDHPLAKPLWTPRNEYKAEPNLTKQIKDAGRPEHPVTLFPVKNEDGKVTELLVIDGNQRVKAALAAELESIPAEIRWEWSLQDAIDASAKINANRKENDFATKMILASRLVALDDKGKVTKHSYEEAGDLMNLSHTVVRSLVKMHHFFPKVIKQAIQTGKLSFTVANTELCKAELLKDKEALMARFEALMKGGGVEDDGTGVPRAKASSQRQAKLNQGEAALTKNQWRIIAQSRECPEEFAALIEVFVGDKTIEWGRSQGLDFLKVPKVEKASKKSKKQKAAESTTTPAKREVDEIESELFG